MGVVMSQARDNLKVDDLLHSVLGLTPDQTPFPWQSRLLEKFRSGQVPQFVDIPTGLGKTSVMAIWLLAKALGAPLPRRLVYIVDRRAVVDQATAEAERLREWLEAHPELKAQAGLPKNRKLPISTLRGQHVDNREWLEDPASPAIIVGTVDMVGSRLLFSGYGVSTKMRPYHAGLLGVDSLFVLDEAHLVPPFGELLRSLPSPRFFPTLKSTHQEQTIIRPLQVIQLSATARIPPNASVFGLSDEDNRRNQTHSDEASKRLHAHKILKIRELPKGDKVPPEELAKEAWRLAAEGEDAPCRVIVYCDERRVAEKVVKALGEFCIPSDEKKSKRRKQALREADVELFVGARRVKERELAAAKLKELGFIGEKALSRPERPTILVATSAGEVGVDMDADHAVCDLVPWERMVQRFGRVNRRGRHHSQIVVLVPSILKKKKKGKQGGGKKEDEGWEGHEECLQILRLLEDQGSANPWAIRQLMEKAQTDPELRDLLCKASSPLPLRPLLTRELVDAWAMTSLEEHPGRPEVEPWLRGWVYEEPQTVVCWRRFLPIRADGSLMEEKDVRRFFEAAPMHLSERLEAPTNEVVDWLVKRAEELDARSSDMLPERFYTNPVVAIAFRGNQIRYCRLSELARASAEDRKGLKEQLKHAELFVDAELGGLNNGLLDKNASGPAETADSYREDGRSLWLTDEQGVPVVRWKVRLLSADEVGEPPESPWRVRLRLAYETNDEDEVLQWLVVYKWCHEATLEDDRSTAPPQLLSEHLEIVASHARELARRLGLPANWAKVLEQAALYHDKGKQASRWQQAFHAPPDGKVYAKTMGPIDYAILDGYRHELGSLLELTRDDDLNDLEWDLLCHLVVAHHGFARPVIDPRGCDQAPPSLLRDRVLEIARRFVRLQRRFGPWGLAWWEALLRAVDQQASREREEAIHEKPKAVSNAVMSEG